jgi:hypothetical protein
LEQDLVEAARVASGGGDDPASVVERLLSLEEEHAVLSERRRRLHESIDLLDGLETVGRDAAARLERYKLTEIDISRRRGRLYREICELRSEQPRRSER